MATTIAAGLRLSRNEPPDGPSAEDVWVRPTPAEMAADTIRGFADRFEWVLDDLRAGL